MQADDFSLPFSTRSIPRPLVATALSFMGGIIYARYFPVSVPYALLFILFLILSWAASLQRGTLTPRQSIHWRMVLILAALLGAIRMQASIQSWENQASEISTLSALGIQTLRGTVEEIQIDENHIAKGWLSGVTVTKGNRSQSLPGKIELYAPAASIQDFLPGDRLETTGQLAPIQGPRIPLALDMQTYRYSQTIFGSVNLSPDTQVLRLPPTSWNWIRGFAYLAVQRIRNGISTNQSGETEYLGLYGSMCFGLRSFLPAELTRALIQSGLIHLISISGLHVTLVLTGAAFLLKRMGLKRKQASWIMGILSFLYLLFVGTSIPTLRSVIMAFIVLGSFWMERRVDAMNNLAFTALVLLLFYPAELFLPSFQLSFVSVWILFLMTPICQYLYERIPSPFLARILQSILVSAAVIWGLAPFTLSYFHIFSWGAIPANLVAAPLAGLLLPLTYLWIVSTLLPFPWLTLFLGDINGTVAHFLISTIYFFAKPVFYLEMPSLAPAQAALLSLAFLFCFHPRQFLFEIRYIPVRGLQVALTALAVAIWLPIITLPWNSFHADFLDLGQGDCIVLRTPDGHTALIDGGATPRNRNSHQPSRLVQYLQSEGIGHIDVLILTHPQSDHIGSLGDVVERIPVSMVLEGCRDSEIETYKQFESKLIQKNVRREWVHQGDRIDLGSQVRLWILNPVFDSQRDQSELNEQSVVVLLQYLDWRLLLTGDITEETERDLCETYEKWNVDVVKVPHHGSRYSNSLPFLREIRPNFAIIQVGNNPYGHPHEETQRRLEEIEAQVFRTDEEGTIRLETWRNQLRLYTTRSEKLYINMDSDKKKSILIAAE